MIDLKQTLVPAESYSTTIGVGLMAVASVIGMLKMPSHTVNKYVLPGQVIKVESANDENLNNPIQREKEDSAKVYISYSESQRTPSRSGKY